MPSTPPPILVRPCFQQDLEFVQLIYGHHVMTGTGTFELEPPSLEEMTARWSRIVTKGWPFLVAAPRQDLSRVLGFAYAGQFRDRPAYATTFEDSIYVAPNAVRQGVGLLLMAELLSMLRSDGVREVLAVIGDRANTASIGLHEKAGFAHVGMFSNVGYKFGRWLDVVLMQRSLAPANNT
ncbi:MAG TPA: GNAT family N-acetyltransferase [Caulobacterales bacterium]|nr:GNAT family N-acetyltransferase [Caulobacterales bacterium]